MEITLTTPALPFPAISLLLLMWSLWLSVVEIRISVQALDLHLRDLEQ